MKKTFSIHMLTMLAVIILAPAAFAQATKSKVPNDQSNPLRELISGYYFTSLATRALQDDDFDNPASLWLDSGATTWNKVEGQAGKACASCHGDAKDSMKGVGTRYPAYDKQAKAVINIEQRINLCRARYIKAAPWRFDSQPLLSVTAHIKQYSRGMPA